MLKKLVFSCLASAGLLFGLDSCPNLSIKAPSFNDARILELEYIVESEISWKILKNTIENYNNTDKPVEYFYTELLDSIENTKIYSDLLKIRYEIDYLVNVLYRYDVDSPQIKKLEDEYDRLLSYIKPRNKNWCNERSNMDIKVMISADRSDRLKNSKYKEFNEAK